ncbi:hypothetical protein, partial [Enterococcus faecalis]|uniref:hypothetical protein n=1 Tax=Enterococcus faecalis TaxID=1351 RepID=UPI001EE9A6C7
CLGVLVCGFGGWFGVFVGWVWGVFVVGWVVCFWGVVGFFLVVCVFCVGFWGFVLCFWFGSVGVGVFFALVFCLVGSD